MRGGLSTPQFGAFLASNCFGRGMANCEHDHHLHAHSGRDKAAGWRLAAALAVIVVFMVIEVIGGIISGSLALLADASHMLTDAMALTLALSAHHLSLRPATQKLNFGYRRFQVLAAFVNGLALIALMAWIIFEALRRSINPVAVDWRPMLAIAVLGLLANIVAFSLLHGADRRNLNVRGAMLHVASDLLGSIAAIVAAGVIAITDFTRIDPILSLVVAGLIGYSAFRLLRESSHILLEGAPEGLDANKIAAELTGASPEIEDVHSVKIWQLTPEHPRITLHARLKEGAASREALARMKSLLGARFGIEESTIQIEHGACCDEPSHAPRKSAYHDHEIVHEPPIGAAPRKLSIGALARSAQAVLK